MTQLVFSLDFVHQQYTEREDHCDLGPCEGSPKKLLALHPWRWTWNIIMEVWKIMFLSKWAICRFQPLIFQGVWSANHRFPGVIVVTFPRIQINCSWRRWRPWKIEHRCGRRRTATSWWSQNKRSIHDLGGWPCSREPEWWAKIGAIQCLGPGVEFNWPGIHYIII